MILESHLANHTRSCEKLFNLCHLHLQLSSALLEILKYPILDLQQQDHKRKEHPVHDKETQVSKWRPRLAGI